MSTHPIEVLLVEDNPNDAELTLHALRQRHMAHCILHVQDGGEALDFLHREGAYAGREMDHALKVVLLDLKMPRLDGLNVLRELKSDPRTQEIPVVMLTSSAEDRDLQEAYRLGANSYIVKPVEFDSFTEAVAQLGCYWLLLNQVPSTKFAG